MGNCAEITEKTLNRGERAREGKIMTGAEKAARRQDVSDQATVQEMVEFIRKYVELSRTEDSGRI